jgi:hypothetical protein
MVEIDHQHDEILELWLGGELLEDRLLRPAGRTPGREDVDENRLPVLLRRAELCLGERLPIGCDGGELAEHDAGENAGGKENPMRDHLLRTSGLAWFAYCSARKLKPNHYALTRP